MIIRMETETRAETSSAAFQPVASLWHTAVVLAVIMVLAIRGWLQAENMRTVAIPDRIRLYSRTILFEWLTLALVLAGVWLHGSSLLTVMGDRWHSVSQFFRHVGIALIFLIATIALTSIAGAHGRAGDQAIQFLFPHGRIEIALWVLLSITAGICEEAIYRGYLQKQFIALTRSVPAGIILSALAFGLAHSYQGFARASTISVMGAMGGVLAYWCRSVRPGMIAHALQDVLGAFIRH
jgi:membrane protease YdiL (CAAX protease family)